MVKAAARIRAMTAEQVAKISINKEPLFILDIRNEEDYNDWKIEGERIVAINIPYYNMLDGADQTIERLPADEPVLVVCAKEGSSIFVAEQLIAAGIEAVFYLEGGMKAWSEYLEPVKVGDLTSGGSLYQFVRIGKGCLSYMIVSDGEAAVIDPPRMTEVFVQFANDREVRIKHVIDTHLHADHISGGRKLAAEAGATYWLPPKDAEDVVFNYAKLEDGQQIAVGASSIKIQAIHSPGHTIGSTSFLVDGRYLLTGDTLFIESIGRPDLAGQAQDWAEELRSTLYGRYKELPEELIVLPAHFGKLSELGEGGKVSARLGDLYRTNPGLNINNEAEFRRSVTDNLPQHPNSYQDIRQANMGKLDPEAEQQREMEIGPNRCAIHN